ncbi:hypothetical protein [Streptomyces sp. NPDC017202]
MTSPAARPGRPGDAGGARVPLAAPLASRTTGHGPVVDGAVPACPVR